MVQILPLPTVLLLVGAELIMKAQGSIIVAFATYGGVGGHLMSSGGTATVGNARVIIFDKGFVGRNGSLGSTGGRLRIAEAQAVAARPLRDRVALVVTGE